MLQLCNLAKINTIAVASNDDKLLQCSSFGANHTINYKKTENWCEKVMELTNNLGVDIITDPVLGSNFN
jgi:NADPH:quinone reductase-like Zn-dependent oxidoreductase